MVLEPLSFSYSALFLSYCSREMLLFVRSRVGAGDGAMRVVLVFVFVFVFLFVFVSLPHAARAIAIAVIDANNSADLIGSSGFSRFVGIGYAPTVGFYFEPRSA